MKTIRFFALSMMIMLASTSVNATSSKNMNVSTSVTTSKVMDDKTVEYKTTFKKDAQGRVVNKVIFKSEKGQWTPVGAYSIHYGEKENVLTYAQWDSKTKTFTRNAQQQHFDSKEFPVVMNAPTE